MHADDALEEIYDVRIYEARGADTITEAVYGIASALRKPCLVIHSDRLDERIWKRIHPGIGNPEYRDLMFAKETIGNIVDHFRKNFP